MGQNAEKGTALSVWYNRVHIFWTVKILDNGHVSPRDGGMNLILCRRSLSLSRTHTRTHARTKWFVSLTIFC